MFGICMHFPSGANFFFLQAEDGIRDGHVTGVQTCALPISQAPATIEQTTSQLQEPSLLKGESKALPPVETPAVPSRKIEPLRADTGLSLFETKIENDTLLKIREDLGDCKRCRLHKTRHSIVFGDGNPNAELVFVGEGPGADEDEQGLPFVGRAGKLLTQMIEAMGLERKDVYICNV